MNATQNKKRRPAGSRNALRGTLALFALGALALLFFLFWVKFDSDSPLAARARDLIGIKAAEGAKDEGANDSQPKGTAPPLANPPAEPAPANPPVPLEAITAPSAPSTPDPPREQLAWSDFVVRRDMWPEELEIMIDQEIPVRYREQRYGEMIFTPGEMMLVEAVTSSGKILGSINGNELFIPAAATNLAEWFEAKHGEYSSLAPAESSQTESAASVPTITEAGEQELLARLRLWAMRNYDTPLIEITADGLILRWSPSEESEIDFRLEAREVARTYLLLSSELGRWDNYANCEIRERRTGELLGSNGIFIPKLEAQP